MKKFLAIILAVLMLVSVTACGKKDETEASEGAGANKGGSSVSAKKEYDEGPVADIKWKLEEGVLTVSGEGRMPNFYNEKDQLLDRPWEKSIDEITAVVIENGITYISPLAFMFCRNMTSVTLPSSVVAIGRSAFYCCYDLAELTIPGGVKMIGDYAFKGCSSLPQITFKGKASAWNEISLGTEAVGVPKIVCTDGEIRLSEETLAPAETAPAQQ